MAIWCIFHDMSVCLMCMEAVTHNDQCSKEPI